MKLVIPIVSLTQSQNYSFPKQNGGNTEGNDALCLSPLTRNMTCGGASEVGVKSDCFCGKCLAL